jgi:pimeloyl-ACP methyl ester carboxylesterase
VPEVQLRGGALDGVRIHHIVDGRGPAVILVHGLGGFAESWHHNLAFLGRQATVYALDLPGFGQSSKPQVGYNLRLFADAVYGFAAALGLERVALVGHSLGGAIVTVCALVHPALVERIALLGAVVPGFDYRLAPLYRLVALRGLGELCAACVPKSVFRLALSRCFAEPAADEVAFLVDWSYAARSSPAGRAAYLATLRGARADFADNADAYRTAVRRLDVPVLAIHGVQDPVVPARHCATVVEALRRGAVRWLDRCGHFPQIEHASTVNAWLAEFLVGRTAPR